MGSTKRVALASLGLLPEETSKVELGMSGAGKEM